MLQDSCSQLAVWQAKCPTRNPVVTRFSSKFPAIGRVNDPFTWGVEFNPAFKYVQVQWAGLGNVRGEIGGFCGENRQIGRFHLPYHAGVGDAFLEISAQVENFVSRCPCNNNVGHCQANTCRRKQKFFIFERT